MNRLTKQIKNIILALIITIPALALIDACKKPELLSEESLNEWYSGGSQTSFVSGSGAYSQMFGGLSIQKTQLHEIGDVAFEAVFNSDATQRNYGLGPVYNNVSCISCHVGDGRGKAPAAGENLSSLLIRISIPGTNPHGGPNPVPGFGGQLQQKGIFGAKQEADVNVNYTEKQFSFDDGETYSLRTPIYSLANSYAALPSSLMISARMAAPVFGLGLLENISENDILKNADENDLNNDGISGKANWVWDAQKQNVALGRFGWKAGQPNIIQQSAGAYNEDMGITSFIFPQESTVGQPQNSLSINKKEISDSVLFAVAYYIKTLSVPGRRNTDDVQVKQGKQLFKMANCNSCHISYFQTQSDMYYPEVSNQKIFPYTDLLLHDMGEGLSDNRPEFKAYGNEWRTAPLWGIGLSKTVNGHNNFLHDGRARNFTEAIMWHGGEAEESKNKFAKMNKAERNAIIKFLESL